MMLMPLVMCCGIWEDVPSVYDCYGPPGLPPKYPLRRHDTTLAVSVGWGFLRGVGARKRPTAWTTSLRNLYRTRKHQHVLQVTLYYQYWNKM